MVQTMTDMSNDLSFPKDTDRINYLDQLISRADATYIHISHGLVTIYVGTRAAGGKMHEARATTVREAIDQSMKQMLEKL